MVIASAHGPDCDDLVGAMDPAATNLCAEHCKSDQKSAQTSTVTVPAALLSVRYETPPLPALAPPPRATAVSMRRLARGRAAARDPALRLANLTLHTTLR